ncbi:hypothetical protein M0R45_031056 [Rubus argutus]
MSIYEIIAHGKHFHHTVIFDSANNIISCSCKKFEFAGILYAHALKVLSTKDIKSIPEQYILKRWTNDIRDKSTKVSCPDANNNDDRKAKITTQSPEVISDDFDDHGVRGIKIKERVARKEDSIRPKNALEKLMGNKRHKKEVNSPCVPAPES